MDNSMPGMANGSPTTLTPLYVTGYDLTNQTQAMTFLSLMLDDSILQIWSKHYTEYFWYGIVTVIGLTAVHNLLWRLTLQSRLRAAAANHSKPAAANTLLPKALVIATAVVRKLSYPQFTPVRSAFWIKIPPFGTIVFVFGYLGFILALEHINNSVQGAQHYAALGIRAGWLAIAQVPLLILLAGKNNLIGLVTGESYERLNVLHRWVARGVLLMAILHVGYQNYGWNQYGLRHLEWTTDTCPPLGLAAFVLLCWLNLSTLAPLRNFGYEIFVFQHLVTFFGFIIAIMLHLPSTALYTRVYIWIPIGLYLFDRLVRTVRSVWNNVRPGRASLEVLAGEVTKIRVQSRVAKWSPGAYVLVCIPRYGIGQSHPATIASTPTSHNGDLVFLLKSRRGFTKHLLKSANPSTTSLLLPSGTKEEAATTQQKTHVTFIDGPYGASQADFACFDTVLLIAGSTGVTFTLPILLDLAHRANRQRQKLPVHRVEFVWIMRNAECTSWIAEELQAGYTALQQAGIDVKIRIFVTRDERLTDLSSATHHHHHQQQQQQHHNPDLTNPLAALTSRPSNNDSGEVSSREEEDSTDTLPPSLTESQSLAVKETSSSLLECATFDLGRPAFRSIISSLTAQAEGETGIAVCGPLGLSAAVRTTVASLITSTGSSKGTGGEQGVYLHVEGFCW